MEAQILRALSQRRVVRFVYGGHIRIGEPHVLGTSRGVLQLLLYQTGGYSSSGGLPNWRRFNVERITDLVLTGERFAGGRAAPSGEHAKWDKQIAYVP